MEGIKEKISMSNQLHNGSGTNGANVIYKQIISTISGNIRKSNISIQNIVKLSKF